MPRGLRYAVVAAAMALASLAGSPTPGTAAPETTASAKPLALGQFTRHRTHARKKHVRPHRSAKKHRSTESRIRARTATSDTIKNAKDESRLASSVADARAEVPIDNLAQNTQDNAKPEASALTEADKTAGEEPLVSLPAKNVEVTTSDQLNELDRAAAEPKPQPAMTLALAQMPEPTESISEGGIWGSASSIGKIFIAFGVLLTLVSAARMLWPQRAA